MLKLLIVDDEWLMRMAIRSMIEWESFGFQVAAEAANGKEALEFVREIKPDLIITDIKMPLMDGLAFIREATVLLPTCSYVILSNFDELYYVKEALRLGASDYLIKSELTPEALMNLLAVLQRKQAAAAVQPMLASDLQLGMSHLRETLFKDVMSGLLEESEAISKAEQLKSQVASSDLAVIKCTIDNFEVLRCKYVEKDEKLLRFSIQNMLEEIIPDKWRKELVVESSSEYLLLVNIMEQDPSDIRAALSKLCGSIQRTLKNFMNISLTIGVSTVVPGFRYMKLVSNEADIAVQQRFFFGKGSIFFFEDMAHKKERDQVASQWTWDEMLARNALDSCNESRITSYVTEFRMQLLESTATERQIRDAYIRLIELIGSQISYSGKSRILLDEKTPYERVLSAETWDEIHVITLEYATSFLIIEQEKSAQPSYADLAVDMIHRFYAEEISLQYVASQINVNPSYLSRIFKQEKGENFINYLTQVRMERAKSFLESGRYKVSEVADKVGYHNYTYFSKIFKKMVGVSPEKYRG